MKDSLPQPGAWRVAYGPHDDQFADLRVPTSPDFDGRVAIVIHGGFWRSHRDVGMTAPLAIDLVARGWATWNLEYARVGGRGGWPTTLEDVARGIDALADVVTGADAVAGTEPGGGPSGVAGGAGAGLDLDRVVSVGHSAGGHLALWSAARANLPDGAPGARPRVRPAAVVSLAGVGDLHAAARDGLGEGATPGLLGGMPEQFPERYAVASPAALLPLGVPQLLAHGAVDVHVPLSHGRAYRDAAVAAGDDARLLEFAGADHFPVIEPDTQVWTTIAEAMADLV